MVHEKVIVHALREAYNNIKPHECIYSRPARCLGDDLKWLAALVAFKYQRLLHTRSGGGRGVTWHMHKYGSLARTTLAGRWKHEATAKIYIDGAAAEWASWQLSADGWSKVKRATKLFKRNFSE